MEIPINYFAVVVAAVSAMVWGFLWYGPVFGKIWIKEMGWTPESIEAAKKKGMAKQYVLQAVGALVMAYVMAHVFVFASTYTQTFGLVGGLMVGFWNWLGFVAPVTLGAVLWEGKSWKLWALNAGYYLVVLCTMGVILSLWQ